MNFLQRHVGQTTAPKINQKENFVTMGNELEKSKYIQILYYKKIQAQLPCVNFEDLSTDPEYLFEICQTAYFPKT